MSAAAAVAAAAAPQTPLEKATHKLLTMAVTGAAVQTCLLPLPWLCHPELLSWPLLGFSIGSLRPCQPVRRSCCPPEPCCAPAFAAQA